MSEHGTAPPGNDAADKEYDELLHLIVDAEWHPGDIVRTSKGVTWQFRETPYTSDFPEANKLHSSDKARKGAFRPERPSYQCASVHAPTSAASDGHRLRLIAKGNPDG